MLKAFSKNQVEFIDKEFGIKLNSNKFGNLDNDLLNDIFEKCLDIEIEESMTDNEMSERGLIAVSIGNLFAIKN